MNAEFDTSSVPYLDEILSYLPIEAEDTEDVSAYLKNITNLIALNYKYEQYQFAYFGLHLLYMTYIYVTVWKISKIHTERYNDAVCFARTYSGRNNELDFENIGSVFEYSLVSEKELPKIFKIIELNEGQIGTIAGLVDTRNDMAHASGKFELLTEISFNTNANSILSSIRNIHNCMDKPLRKWYEDFLLQLCNGEFEEYTDFNDLIFEKMIQGFNLSMVELSACNKMSLQKLRTDYPQHRELLKRFENDLSQYCQNNGYITD
ncbi:MAG: hypothetical protein LBP79_04410 [Clostridiales bacterium]|jgi:hypothetical protein|nr:hypothetical protein [Clostridiales bacterium]